MAETASSHDGGGGTTQLLASNSSVSALKATNAHVDFALQICRVTERLGRDNIDGFLSRVEALPGEQIGAFADCLIGLFFGDFRTEAVIRLLDLALKACDANRDVSVRFGYHVLVRLARAREPRLQVALVRALPKLAAVEDNLPGVILILESMRGQADLLPVLATVYYELWRSNDHCYGYLQNVLVEECEGWEFGVVRAHVLKQIALAMPEKYGTELVVYLSNIMNKCVGAEGALATSLAIQGIVALCQNGIVDVVSVLDMIMPKLGADGRPRVVQRYARHFQVRYHNLTSLLSHQFRLGCDFQFMQTPCGGGGVRGRSAIFVQSGRHDGGALVARPAEQSRRHRNETGLRSARSVSAAVDLRRAARASPAAAGGGRHLYDAR